MSCIGVLEFTGVKRLFCEIRSPYCCDENTYCPFCHDIFDLTKNECSFCHSIYEGETILG
jgi:hypothetical protein